MKKQDSRKRLLDDTRIEKLEFDKKQKTDSLEEASDKVRATVVSLQETQNITFPNLDELAQYSKKRND